MPLPSLKQSKAHWRQWAKGVRASENILAQSSKLMGRFKILPFMEKASEQDHLLLYSPMRGEFDPLTLLYTFPGTCYLPRILDPDKRLLSFHVATPQTPLCQNPRYGLLEPYPNTPKFNPNTVSDSARVIVLVPALATDAQGYRLGYGGGYYDTFLHQLCNSTFTGRVFTVCWITDERHVPKLPTEPTDVPVGWIVTPTQFIHPGK